MHVCLFSFLSIPESWWPNSDSLALLIQSYIPTCILVVCVCVYFLISCLFSEYGLQLVAKLSVSPRYRALELSKNQLQCVPISAQQMSTLSRAGPVQSNYQPTTTITCTSIPWTVAFGGCTFSGDYAGAPLVRTGSCPTQGGSLDLQSKFITSVPPDAFQGMPQMT